MKPKKLAHTNPIIPLLAALTCLCLPGRTVATTINFDDVSDNTIINTNYAGVTLTNPIGGNVYARNRLTFATSQSNVISIISSNSSLFPFFDAASGAVDAHFPQRSGR